MPQLPTLVMTRACSALPALPPPALPTRALLPFRVGGCVRHVWASWGWQLYLGYGPSSFPRCTGVSYLDKLQTHTLTNISLPAEVGGGGGVSWGQASIGLHARCMSPGNVTFRRSKRRLACLFIYLDRKKSRGMARVTYGRVCVCVCSCEKQSMFSPVSSRKYCQSYGLNAIVLHCASTHTLTQTHTHSI